MLALRPSPGGNKPQLCLFTATVTGLFPQKVSEEQQEGPAPSPPSRGRSSCTSWFGGAKCNQRSRRAPTCSKQRERQVPSRVPGGRLRARICLRLRMSARICVYVCASACVRVAPCVWRGFWVCTGVFSHRALSEPLRKRKQAWKPGSCSPSPGSSAASRQTVTAGLMTEHTRFPSGLLNCAVRYSETKEIKDYTDGNKYVTGATRGRRLPGRLGTVPSRRQWWEKGLTVLPEPRAWDQAWLGLGRKLGGHWQRRWPWERPGRAPAQTRAGNGHVGFLMETCVGACQVPGFFFSLAVAQIFSNQRL